MFNKTKTYKYITTINNTVAMKVLSSSMNYVGLLQINKFRLKKNKCTTSVLSVGEVVVDAFGRS